jgi:two-component system chemotaxis response regulator CheB
MYAPKKLRVLVIDDSLVFREAVARGISKDKGIEVVATAANPYEARDRIEELEPDILTLDIEMPKMNGIEFLKKLMPQYPMPVVVVSALSDNVFEALNAGAVDFVTKPDSKTENGMDGFINELIVKIKIASMAKVTVHKSESIIERLNTFKPMNPNTMIIAIGASTGGTEAILDVIQSFPREMPGILIVQHMPPVFTRMYADRLNNICKMEVKEAENGDVVMPGRVLIAPGDKHMKMNKKGNLYVVECFDGDKVNGHRPSVDILFDSVAEKAGTAAIGIILTGMGYDGAKGLLKMKQKGAVTIGQDEKSCVVYGMPKVAYDIGAVVKQVTLKNIPNTVLAILNGRG